MKLPLFAESDHPLIQTLQSSPDLDLIRWLQQYPDQGRYFTTIYCRYGHLVYALLQNSACSPIQQDYLFARIWRTIFEQLPGLDLEAATPGQVAPFSLQTWVLNLTAACIHQTEVPPVETIHYSLNDAPPPLWCYLTQALDRLPPTLRLIVVMSKTFHWGENRIVGYLQSEGEDLAPAAVAQQLQEGLQLLETALPGDIQMIYLGKPLEAGTLSATVTGVGELPERLPPERLPVEASALSSQG